jgi:hypothetical protein
MKEEKINYLRKRKPTLITEEIELYNLFEKFKTK